MGIVLNQSFKNTISTYLGFAIGAVNTLFLYTNFLSETYYGLVAFLLSAANIMMPFMAFGVHNAIIKYYSTFTTKTEIDSFLSLMLVLPCVLIVPICIIGYVSNDIIVSFLSEKNPIAGAYVWHIGIVAIAMAYFEIFYSWSKVQLQTVFGNIMKEVFHRICILILLVLVNIQIVSASEFIIFLVGVYVARMLIMMLYAFAVKLPRLKLQPIKNFKSILNYAGLMIIAGSVAMLLLDIDKFMIGLMLEHIELVAYYSVSIFIATVIAVPQRAMHQIMMPLTAQYLNDKNSHALSDLYKRSSLNLLVVSGFIFSLIILNIKQLYLILPEQFTGGLFIIIIIGIAKLYDNSLGNNNAILFNSAYYRIVLFFGVLLVLLAVILNVILIPLYGIEGSAIATFIAVVIYNSLKIYFIKLKFNIQPFTWQSLVTLLVIVLHIGIFFFWDFNFYPIVSILIKSTLAAILYGSIIYKLNISEDITAQLKIYLKLK